MEHNYSRYRLQQLLKSLKRNKKRNYLIPSVIKTHKDITKHHAYIAKYFPEFIKFMLINPYFDLNVNIDYFKKYASDALDICASQDRILLFLKIMIKHKIIDTQKIVYFINRLGDKINDITITQKLLRDCFYITGWKPNFNCERFGITNYYFHDFFLKLLWRHNKILCYDYFMQNMTRFHDGDLLAIYKEKRYTDFYQYMYKTNKRFKAHVIDLHRQELIPENNKSPLALTIELNSFIKMELCEKLKTFPIIHPDVFESLYEKACLNDLLEMCIHPFCPRNIVLRIIRKHILPDSVLTVLLEKGYFEEIEKLKYYRCIGEIHD